MQNNLQNLLLKDFSVTGESFYLKKNESYGFYETHPRPPFKVLDTYYNSDDYISHTNSKRSLFEGLYHFVRKITLKNKFSLINSFEIPTKRLLDVGCGTGAFISYASHKSWHVTGIEPNYAARSRCTDTIKSFVFDTHHLNILSKETFDVITLWHVMEHIYRLEDQMNLICSLLHNKGRLIVALPNYKSFDSKYYKEKWAAFDVPRHLYHFNQNSVEQFFKKRNFKLLKVKPMFFDAFYVSILSERYKKNRFALFKGALIGLISNLHALKTGEFSSKIYILEKKAN